MTESTALTILSATVGFCASVFFCVGSALNSTKNIVKQATPYWDFSEPVAHALASQRAQYATGAMLLAISFPLQVAATLASPTTPANLPQWLGTWQRLAPSALALSAAVGWLTCRAIKKHHSRAIKQHMQSIEDNP